MIARRFDTQHSVSYVLSHRVSNVLNPGTPSDTITQSEIRFRSLPVDAAGCNLDVAESGVSEVKPADSGTPTSFSPVRVCPGERRCPA